jgi:hypothetical protein
MSRATAVVSRVLESPSLFSLPKIAIIHLEVSLAFLLHCCMSFNRKAVKSWRSNWSIWKTAPINYELLDRIFRCPCRNFLQYDHV